MTREELREHCEKQIKDCEMWARIRGEDPHDRIYEEHKLILELLEQEPTTKNDLGVDLISRADVIRIICEYRDDAVESGNERDLERAYGANAVGELINELPSVTPIRPKGHWIETAEEYYKAINEKGGGVNENTDYFVDDIACSECLAKFSVIDNEAERFDFCPCCGSDNR